MRISRLYSSKGMAAAECAFLLGCLAVISIGGIRSLSRESERKLVCSAYVLKLANEGGGSNTSNGDGTIGGPDDVAAANNEICPRYVTAAMAAAPHQTLVRAPEPGPTPKGGPIIDY